MIDWDQKQNNSSNNSNDLDTSMSVEQGKN